MAGKRPEKKASIACLKGECVAEPKASRAAKRQRPATPGAANAASESPHARAHDFTLKKALFEIAIVTVGVLLALIVDEWRQSRVDRALAEEARSAMNAEIEQNRVRLASKLTLLHMAYVALQADPAAGPKLVSQRSNFQIALTSAAWSTALQTGALRLLDQQERQSLAYVYTSHDIYNQLLAEEMKHWTAMASADPGGSAARLWQAYAQRMGSSACIASIRIERVRNPTAAPARLQRACQSYTISRPPAELYKALNFEMPDTDWRLGADF